MKKNRLGQTEIFVTSVGFGVLPMGPHQMNLPLSEGGKILSYALSKGINFIDTAQYYRTYPYIREVLCQRESTPVISCKSLATSYEEMKLAVAEACHEMGVKKIDIFLLHEVRNGDFLKRKGAWEALKESKNAGLVDAIGVSTHHVDVALEMVSVADCDVVFPLINYAGLGIRKGNGSGTRAEMEEAIRLLAKAGKGVFTMKAFGGGPLISHYQEALNYSLSVEGSDSAMIGFGSMKDVDDIIIYLDGTMDADYTPDVSAKKIRIETGSCEGCGNCIKRCPNKAISFSKTNGLAQIDHDRCMTCGYCTPVCPVRAIIMY